MAAPTPLPTCRSRSTSACAGAARRQHGGSFGARLRPSRATGQGAEAGIPGRREPARQSMATMRVGWRRNGRSRAGAGPARRRITPQGAAAYERGSSPTWWCRPRRRARQILRPDTSVENWRTLKPGSTRPRGHDDGRPHSTRSAMCLGGAAGVGGLGARDGLEVQAWLWTRRWPRRFRAWRRPADGAVLAVARCSSAMD